MKNIKQWLVKLEAALPMELALSVSYDDCLIIFTGRLSRTVHFRLTKEREEVEVEIPARAEHLEFPLETPIKYADPIDEVSARRARAQIDRAIMELMQERELNEMRRIARETNSDQEPTIRIAV